MENVINLTGDKNPHGYKISPQDRVKLLNADLVIYQGLGMESWSEDLIPALKEKNIATLEASHRLLLLEKTNEHEDEENHENEEGHKDEEHDEHNHGEFDPHTWLDPVLALNIAEYIAQELIALDPKNEEQYLKNLQRVQEKLTALHSEYTKTLSNCSRPEALISHNALGYLEFRYNFNLHPITGFSPNDEPSAKLLAQLKKIVEKKEITHILTEQNNIQKYAQTLSNETGITMLPINPMGITPQNGNYFDISRQNLASLSESLGCK